MVQSPSWEANWFAASQEIPRISRNPKVLLHSPVTSSLVGPNILLNTMFSNTLSFLSSRNVNDQVSHPYNTTGKIIFLDL